MRAAGLRPGLLGLIALLWEWRARKMGVAITAVGIVATRVVGSMNLKWIPQDRVVDFLTEQLAGRSERQMP